MKQKILFAAILGAFAFGLYTIFNRINGSNDFMATRFSVATGAPNQTVIAKAPQIDMTNVPIDKQPPKVVLSSNAFMPNMPVEKKTGSVINASEYQSNNSYTSVGIGSNQSGINFAPATNALLALNIGNNTGATLDNMSSLPSLSGNKTSAPTVTGGTNPVIIVDPGSDPTTPIPIGGGTIILVLLAIGYILHIRLKK